MTFAAYQVHRFLCTAHLLYLIKIHLELWLDIPLAKTMARRLGCTHRYLARLAATRHEKHFQHHCLLIRKLFPYHPCLQRYCRCLPDVCPRSAKIQIHYRAEVARCSSGQHQRCLLWPACSRHPACQISTLAHWLRWYSVVVCNCHGSV